MSEQNESAHQIERYLLRFRSALGRMPTAEKREIVSDIRSHIADRLAESQNQPADALPILDVLGTPESLAQTYRTEGLLSRAAATLNPWLLLRAMFVWAFIAVEGFLALIVVFTGYVAALSFLACAVLKPFFPNLIGMWADPPLFSIGIRHPSWHPEHELLGYWIIPVGLMVGVFLFILTTRFGRWAIRKFALQLQPTRFDHLAKALALLAVVAVAMNA